MKRQILSAFVVVFFLSGVAEAQLFQARLVTSAYSWQRLDASRATENHLFAFQGVQLMLGSTNVTVRTYMQGFNDFAGPLKNDPVLRLYSLSVNVRNIFSMADIEAGRFYVFGGASSGLIDGASVTVRPMGDLFDVRAYYGLLAPGDRSIDLSDAESYLAGVRLRGQPTPDLNVSLSFARKQYSQQAYRGVRADTLLNPVTLEFSPTARTEDIISADARYDVSGMADVYARYDYDLGAEQTARLNAFGRVRVMDDVSLIAEYLQREPRISYQSIFSVFTYSTVKDVSAGVEYGFMKGWYALANYGTISYGSESSQRITLGVNGDYVSASFSKNISDRSDLDAASVNAGYPLFDKLITPTLLVSYAHYKLDDAAPVNDAIGVAGGVVVRPLAALVVDAQVQWMNNKVYTSDMRFFLRVSYAMSHRLSLF